MFEICQHWTVPLWINLFLTIAFWAFNTIMKRFQITLGEYAGEQKQRNGNCTWKRKRRLSVKKTGFYLLTADHMLRSAGYSPAKHAAGSGR